MNRYFKFLTLSVGLGLLTGCDKMLTPKPVGVQTLDVSFNDLPGSIAAVNGMYSVLTSSNLYRGNMDLLNVDYASDDVMATNQNTTGYNSLDYFELVADNGQTFGIWDNFYRIIFRANVVLARVPNLNFPIAQRLNPSGQLWTVQFVGEAKFLRAFCYFNLVRLFSDVPMHVAEIKGPSEVNIPRTPAAKVYEQIIEDLKDAADKLPSTYSGVGAGNEKGRPTRWAALAMLADVYLTQKNYLDAKTISAQVIAQSGLNLNTTYSGNFSAKGGEKNGIESLFEIQFANEGRVTGTAPLGNPYSFIMGAGDGADRENGGQSLSQYRPTNTDDVDNEPGFTGGLIQEYENGDLRRTVTFVRVTTGAGLERWLTFKHHRPNTQAVGQANFPVYRLAEVILIYAEATNEDAVLDAQGLDWLNRLRRRAFGLPLNTPNPLRDIALSLSQTDYRNLIRSERRKELAMENHRWFDLLRYGFDYANTALKVNQKRLNFNRDKMLLPIARIETINNPLLTQNPGY